MEDKMRLHIARALVKKILTFDPKEFNSKDFAETPFRTIKATTMARYIPREPLFRHLRDDQDEYPCYEFIWAPRKLFRLEPAKDWQIVLRAAFTTDILDKWMLYSTKSTKRGKVDPFILERASTLFSNKMAMLRLKNKPSTNHKIVLIKNHIQNFWNVAYGHKK